MKKLILIVCSIFLLKSVNSYSQNCDGETLNNSEITGTAAFCSDTGITFCNSLADGSTNPATQAAAGPAYGCLASQPYPSWFFIRVDDPGNLALTITQRNLNGNPGDLIDVDFIIWGPYTETELDNIRGGDYSLLDSASIKDCSYLVDAIEFLEVNSVQNGEYYVILVTNFQEEAGTISMESTNPSDPNGATTDCSIISSTLGPDQKVCDGTEITLDATPSNGTVTAYKWFLDTGSGFNEIVGETSATLLINNNTSGIYKVEVTDNTGGTGSDEVEITFFPNPVANNIDDILYCDTDGDGFHTFDLQSLVTPLILNGQDANQFDIIYYSNINDANANISGNALPNNYTNPTAFGSQNIFARIHNKNAPTACYDVTQFNITVSSEPEVTQPTDYIVCDDLISGSDTDGIFNNFDLASKDSEILGSLSTSTFSVSYHTTLTGAQTNSTTDVIDKSIPYTNITANSQTIYVRVENSLNTDCNVVTEPSSTSFIPFNLVINSLPTVVNNIDLRQCDTDADLTTIMNLTLAQQNISVNHTNETFQYYPTQNDAISNTNIISNPASYNASNGQMIWVRTINNNQCYRISSINIIVGYASNVAYNNQFYECDDFLDTNGNDITGSNDNTDGITNFNLSSVVTDVKALFPANIQPDLDILVFENMADRNTVTNAIPDLSSYRNINLPALTPQTLYLKIINSQNNECVGLGEFTILTSIPEANVVTPIVLCDDRDSGSSTDGENINIDLRAKVNDILGTQNPNDFTVSFHTSFNDALSASNPITNDSSYRNTAPAGFVPGTISEQTIYVAVQDNATSCINPNTQFNITINPLSELSMNITPIELCDAGTEDNDTRNGLEQNIDLAQRINEILNGRDIADYIISFHNTEADSYTALNPVPLIYDMNPANTNIVNNIGEEILWVSLESRDSGCISGGSQLLLRVFPEPDLPTSIMNYIECDHNNGGLSSDTDGIIEDINLSTKIQEILANYSASEYSNFNVTFHPTLADANANINGINSNEYTNLSTPQTIYIRVEDKQSGCYNTNLTFDIIINELPYFEVTTPQIVCLNTPPLNIAVENSDSATYEYEWVNSNQPNATIGITDNINVSNGGTYIITATNTTTGCQRPLEIVVNESVIASIQEDDVTVIDDTNNNGNNNYSIIINNENNNLGIGDYEFALQSENGDIVATYQDEPKFENLQGGIYTILVQDKNDCGIAQVEIALVEFPKFFTPNQDGYNDIWTVRGVNSTYFPLAEVIIFDRFGKTISKQNINEDFGWDGSYNGQTLPSNDYWFRIILTDKNDKTYIRSGHFSLLRN
ncbi:gliding motility-associated C-terminal domain-containing protein [Tenacibaculum sp. MAR_2009_124]|uniref:T9SS type B sorting domain-containing protein n=1 Tax=Tenacibaculum sp. MAR_2009_124 TaxID=1250059 RepID=UPI000894F462|nr:T9SS type B sorting domain-containing protein [Tenacibaculum sp. MAR_2009_124]SEB40229.1 gliding motility-associated C-terminal domain-containing protein [Tenacibaculum sp. MAR_2009_124]